MASEGLMCSICCERFDDQNLCPRVINCGHSFCTSCLEKLLHGNAIYCPTCRNAVSVPTGNPGVAGLPKNFALLDVVKATPQHAGDGGLHFCEACDGEQHPAISCCLDCLEDMCRVAAGFHDTSSKASHDHCVVSLEELKDKAASKCRLEMEVLVTKASNRVEKIKAAEARVTVARLQLNEACKEKAARIEDMFKDLYAALTTRKQFLMNKLDQLHKTKAGILTEQQESLRMFQARLQSVVQRATSTIQISGNAELLVRAIESQSPVLEPQANGILEVTFNDRNLLSVLNNAGVVSDKSATGRRLSIVFEPGVSHR